MFIVHPELARLLAEERVTQAQEARTITAHRRQRRAARRKKTADIRPEAEVIELAFGTNCDSDQIGA